MLISALGFSVMGAAARMLKDSFNAGQLVFYRNAIGLLFLSISLIRHWPRQEGGRAGWLVFRGLMGAIALYTFMYSILHLPLGTAMTYNQTSSLYITLFGFLLFGEYHGRRVIAAVIFGFIGMLMVYKPGFGGTPWQVNLIGVLSGLTSAIAYLTVGRLSAYYNSRIIVLAFMLAGVLLPALSFSIQAITGLEEDGLFIIRWIIPSTLEQWGWLTVLGLSALVGQYFVTLAYGAEKPSLVSAIGYSNIIFSLILGLLLGDRFPDLWSLIGIITIIGSGILIAWQKKNIQPS